MTKVKKGLQIRMLDSTKRRLAAIADDKNMSMNEIVNIALKNYIDEIDMEYTEPNIVVDRLNEVLTSQMQVVQGLSDLKFQVRKLEDTIENE